MPRPQVTRFEEPSAADTNLLDEQITGHDYETTPSGNPISLNRISWRPIEPQDATL